MDVPRPPGDNGNGDDGPGRPPRKQVDGQDEETNENSRVEAFGDGSDLPMWAFLFLAALFVEQFRVYCTC